MRQLSFKGFLRQYVRELSYCKSSNIRFLANEIPENNYRLVEPLVLYALSIDKGDYLRRVAEDSYLMSESFRFECMKLDEVESLLETGDVPHNYSKLYQSYTYFRDKQKNQNHTKTLIRDKINELKQEKNISMYRIYTDLKLNNGCVHSYVKNGNAEGIGLESAKRILDYLKAAQTQKVLIQNDMLPTM